MREKERQEAAERWLPFVQAFVTAYEQGIRLSGGERLPGLRHGERRAPVLPGRGGERPTVLLCSPHPDDEVLTGTLPLRLLREQGARVINLAMTLGSNPARQAARWQELEAACAVAGFECRHFPAPLGFDLKAGVKGKGWPAAVASLIGVLEELQPDFVFFPHGQDHHPAHVQTSRLVSAALGLFTRREGGTVRAVETEYWRPMAAPNLLVGAAAEDLALLLSAVACHRGEIARNPYHLTYPARLMDAVRRGAELVPSTTAARSGFVFGELYRLSGWRQGRRRALPPRDGRLGPEDYIEF